MTDYDSLHYCLTELDDGSVDAKIMLNDIVLYSKNVPDVSVGTLLLTLAKEIRMAYWKEVEKLVEDTFKGL
jgi:hypothetical protein